VTVTQQQNAPVGCGSVIQHVVAQGNVTMMNKGKATCANEVGQGCR